MSDVYEIYNYEWNEETEVMHVEAEVSDSILAYHATQYEPEQWTHGRCYVEVLWPDEPIQSLNSPSLKEQVWEYVKERSDIEWTLIPLDNSIEEAQLCDVL